MLTWMRTYLKSINESDEILFRAFESITFVQCYSVSATCRNGANAISYGMLSRYLAWSQKLCANYFNINLLRALCSVAFFNIFCFTLLKCDLLSSWRAVHCRWNQKMNVNHTSMDWIREIQKSNEYKPPDSNRSSLFVTKMAVFFSYLDCGALIINPAYGVYAFYFCCFFFIRSERARNSTWDFSLLFFFLLFRRSETTLLFCAVVSYWNWIWRRVRATISYPFPFKLHSIRTLNKHFSIVVHSVRIGLCRDVLFFGLFYLCSPHDNVTIMVKFKEFRFCGEKNEV